MATTQRVTILERAHHQKDSVWSDAGYPEAFSDPASQARDLQVCLVTAYARTNRADLWKYFAGSDVVATCSKPCDLAIE